MCEITAKRIFEEKVYIVLFDDKKCKAIRSDIIKVADIELKLDAPDIYQLEEFLGLQ